MYVDCKSWVGGQGRDTLPAEAVTALPSILPFFTALSVNTILDLSLKMYHLSREELDQGLGFERLTKSSYQLCATSGSGLLCLSPPY